MSIYPFFNENLTAENIESDISREYDLNTGRIVEGAEAIKIWISNALKTKRYRYPIYSFDYGQEFDRIIGRKVNIDYIKSEIERYIKECLLINEKIQEISKLDIQVDGSRVTVTFTAKTIYGEVDLEYA